MLSVTAAKYKVNQAYQAYKAGQEEERPVFEGKKYFTNHSGVFPLCGRSSSSIRNTEFVSG